MLVPLLVSFLLAISGDLASGSLQTTPQVVTGNAATKLSAAEVSELQKKANSGDGAAQFALGKAYESGNGVPQRPDQVATWYRKAAEQGNAKAQNSLGVLYWLGDGVEKDRGQAVQWYRKAARQGDANAMFNLGAAYYNGDGVGLNDTLAYAWFLLSSDAGSSSGQDAANRSHGEHGPNAINDACLAIGQMYEKGEDLPKNRELAAAWYRKAAERGYPEATIKLAVLYLNSADYSQARPWCEAAAKERLPGGYYCLGNLYQHGFGVEQNLNGALLWYLQAAKAGNLAAVQTVARMYARGEGTKVDRPEAFIWLLRLSSQKNDALLDAEKLRRQKSDALLDAQELRSSMTEQEWKDTQKKLRRQGFNLKAVDQMLRTVSQAAQ